MGANPQIKKPEVKEASGLHLFVRFKVHTKDGKLLYDSGQRAGQCFLLQFLQCLHIHLHEADGVAGASKIDVRDVGGTLRSLFTESAYSWIYCTFYFKTLVENDDYGVVVGTDSTSVTNTDYALGAQIAEGNGSGQLLHGSTNIGAPGVSGSNVDMVITRTFTNDSGSSITVEETGIYLLGRAYGGGAVDYYFAILRDVTGGVAVADGNVLTVEYLWRTTV